MKAEQRPNFEVWRENWTAVRFFLDLTTQWHWGAMGGAHGLNYQSLDFLLKIYSVKKPRLIFEKIKIMEAAALKVLNKPREG